MFFTMDMLLLSNVITRPKVSLQCYIDDTRLFTPDLERVCTASQIGFHLNVFVLGVNLLYVSVVVYLKNQTFIYQGLYCC